MAAPKVELGLPPLGLYVHMPWCVRKCPYCDFNSHALKGELPADDYVDALQKCLATLPARSRQLLQSTYADGVGRAAAAKQIGMGLEGIKSALRRLRAWLHDCITQRLQRERLEDER